MLYPKLSLAQKRLRYSLERQSDQMLQWHLQQRTPIQIRSSHHVDKKCNAIHLETNAVLSLGLLHPRCQ